MIVNFSDLERATGFVAACNAIGLKETQSNQRDRRRIAMLQALFMNDLPTLHAILGCALELERVSAGEDFSTTIEAVCANLGVDENVAEGALRLHMCTPRVYDRSLWSNGVSQSPLWSPTKKAAA